MAQTPPCHLPDIPGVTSPGAAAADEPKAEAGSSLSNHDAKPSAGTGSGASGVAPPGPPGCPRFGDPLTPLSVSLAGDDAQFEMDI